MSIESPHGEKGTNGDGTTTVHRPTGRVSTESSPGTGRFLAIAIIVLIIALGTAFGLAYWVHTRTETQAQQLADGAADIKPVVVVVAARTTAHNYPLTLPGQTAGWYQSTIFARVDGYIGSWSSDIGDRVKQGQVLAQIETPELDQTLEAARGKAATTAAQVDVAQARVSITKLTWERWRDSPKGVVSEQEREDKQADYQQAVASLAAARAQAKADDSEVQRLLAMTQFKKVIAPYNGVITARRIDVGDLIGAGSSSNTTPLYSMAQSDVIRVYVDVPQKAAAETTVGLPADITSDQFPGRVFPGKVARSAMSIDPQTRTQRTEVDIDNKDLALVPGMYVQVTFKLTETGLPEVPAAAILFRPSGLQVAVVGDDGKVSFRDVTVSKDNGDVVVIQSGIRPGDKVALNLSSAISPGEDVSAQEDTSNDIWPSSGS
jgi:RND family efflux transporter MFP subunit